MPQIKITIPEEVHTILKERAERDDRSLNNYLGRLLRHISQQPELSNPPVSTFPPTSEPIPETPYKITATAGLSQPVFTETTTTYYPTPEPGPAPAKPKRKSIIGDDPPEVVEAELAKNRPFNYDEFITQLYKLEANMKDVNNEDYQKIKKYCLRHDKQKELLDILLHPNIPYLKSNHEYIISKAFALSPYDTIPKDGWLEIVEHLQ